MQHKRRLSYHNVDFTSLSTVFRTPSKLQQPNLLEPRTPLSNGFVWWNFHPCGTNQRLCTSLLISRLRRLIDVPIYCYKSTFATCCCESARYFSRGPRGRGLEILVTAMCACMFDFCLVMRYFRSVVERCDDGEGVGYQDKCG
jgi:hypothetical protein